MHASFHTSASISARKILTSGFAGSMRMATVYFDSYCKIAFLGQCTDLYSPLPHLTVPASPCLLPQPMILLSDLKKTTIMREIEHHPVCLSA